MPSSRKYCPACQSYSVTNDACKIALEIQENIDPRRLNALTANVRAVLAKGSPLDRGAIAEFLLVAAHFAAIRGGVRRYPSSRRCRPTCP